MGFSGAYYWIAPGLLFWGFALVGIRCLTKCKAWLQRASVRISEKKTVKRKAGAQPDVALLARVPWADLLLSVATRISLEIGARIGPELQSCNTRHSRANPAQRRLPLTHEASPRSAPGALKWRRVHAAIELLQRELRPGL